MTTVDGSSLVDIGRREGRPVCLDTSAMLAFLSNEPGATYVSSLFKDVDLSTLISTVTLAEIAVRPARDGRDAARAIVEHVTTLPRLQIQSLDETVAVETAIVRATTGLRLPDATVVATARLHSAIVLISNDRGWRNKAIGVPIVLLSDLDL